MNKYHKLLSLMVGGVMTVALFAGCGGGTSDVPPDDGEKDPPPAVSDAAVRTTICYDNLPDDGVSLDASDTSVTVKGLDVSKFAARNAGNGKIDDYTKVATYDETTGVFTAVGAGSITYVDSKSVTGRVTVVPAYVENPDYAYSGNLARDTDEKESTLLGHTHDPSFVEVSTSSGSSLYYLFSTGWADQTDGTYGNAIHESVDLIHWDYVGRTFDVATRDEDFVDTKAGDWLYGGITSGYNSNNASWWAPDIVPAKDGGYWLYTCVVDGAGDSQGMQLPGGNYARACILLYHSDTVDAGSFKPVHDDNGDPVVLMQSSILRGEHVADVNGIDPQIIYTPDGKMYMAYGSFGSGDYIIELDPETGMRKDGKGWQTHDQIRGYVNDIQDDWGSVGSDSVGWVHDYYGTNISKSNMEAPVIARHDNVTVMDENETVLESGKTYYYSMHSFDGLGDNYQMYGGRSESVTGVYQSTSGEGIVRNVGPGDELNAGNKYMGAFSWSHKADGVKEYDIILPGHNDLYTTLSGVSLAAYITRLPNGANDTGNFVTQIHQYYLNSYGQIVINPNRYGGEIDRAVSEAELLKYTLSEAGGYKFQMVVMANQRDTQSGAFNQIQNKSRDIYLTAEHTITESNGTKLGTWKMYGKGYIKFEFDANLKGAGGADSGNKVFYGVVRPAWLGDQNKSGFTITCMGQTENTIRSMAMFMNNYSTLEGASFVG